MFIYVPYLVNPSQLVTALFPVKYGKIFVKRTIKMLNLCWNYQNLNTIMSFCTHHRKDTALKGKKIYLYKSITINTTLVGK